MRIKLLKYGEVNPANLLNAEDITKEMFGTEKIYLENQVLSLKTEYEVRFYGYHLVFEIKNGTENSRMYTIQVWYE